ncbi:MAG: helix-turn-helix domain-containing protein [Pseudonocardiales bacterium]|nr:helix-turn-helix domain-containing protein [Pseudonocardiales bacterium]
MAVRGDPSALRWLIGVELANFRKRAGQTITSAAKVINCSPAKIGHLESGRNQQQPADVTALLRFYGADVADVDRLARLAGSADHQTWWAPWTDVVPDWLKTFVGLEGMATRSSSYSPLIIPALLQTEAYSLGVTAGSSRVRPDQDERIVSLRVARQRRIHADAERLLFTAVIEEAVLDRVIGGPVIMSAQLEHLTKVAELDNVELRVLLTSVGAHDALVGEFTVLDFAAAQSVGYVELVNGAVYIQDQDQVAGYTRIVDRLREVALSPDDTVQAIRSRLAALQ